ncbi:MAG: HEAT repeat domain-containing protein [Elusimicrobiales bacterium]|jgi:hypothetical protein
MAESRRTVFSELFKADIGFEEPVFTRKERTVFPAVCCVIVFISGIFSVTTLGAAPSDNGVKGKISAAKAEKELPGRERLYRELGAIQSDEAVVFLSRAAISEPEPGGRTSAITALRKTGGRSALNGILAALKVEKHKGVRIQAVNSLGFFNDPKALERLRDIVGTDLDRDMRIAAYMALSRLGDAETLSKDFDLEKDPGAKLGILDALSRTEDGENKLRGIKERSGDKAVKARIDLHMKKK